MRELELRLYTLEQELVSLSAQFGPDWPSVRQTQSEIEGIRAQLRREADLALEKERIEFESRRTASSEAARCDRGPE